MMTILFKLSWDLIMIAVACYWFARARIAWREGSQNYVKVHGPPRTWTIRNWCTMPIRRTPR